MGCTPLIRVQSFSRDEGLTVARILHAMCGSAFWLLRTVAQAHHKACRMPGSHLFEPASTPGAEQCSKDSPKTCQCKVEEEVRACKERLIRFSPFRLATSNALHEQCNKTASGGSRIASRTSQVKESMTGGPVMDRRQAGYYQSFAHSIGGRPTVIRNLTYTEKTTSDRRTCPAGRPA